jgi:hypothetical protein
MARLRTHLATSGLVFGLCLLAPIAATGSEEGSFEAEAFEVIVVRGAGVVRVTGNRSGVIREEVLREDPRPARPRARDETPKDNPVVVVVNAELQDATPTPSLLYAVHSARKHHGASRHGSRPGRAVHHQRVYRPDGSKPRYYHARSRGLGRPMAKPDGRRR